MNRYMENQWSWIDGSHAMRSEMLDTLTDADLAFKPGGQTMSFGALWRQMGEIEHAYVQSLKDFKQDFVYRYPDATIETSVTKLKTWFQTLDDDMKATVSAFSDDDLKKSIERGSGFSIPVDTQLDVYLQALLIFFGKASIYLRLMNKPLTKAIEDWIW